MKKINLYNILKLNSSQIIYSTKKKKIIRTKNKNGKGEKTKEVEYFCLNAIPMSQAEANKQVISVADNLMFREIRKYKKDNLTQEEKSEQLAELRLKVNDIKKQPDNKENRSKLEETQNAIDKFLFVPEVISVNGSKTDYKKFGKKGFYYNGKLYTRFCASSGNLKDNTVIFVEEKVNNRISEIFSCGHNNIIDFEEVIPAKYGAYQGLTTSGVYFVSNPKVIVIPDFEFIIPDEMVNFVDKEMIEGQSKYTVTPQNYMELVKQGKASALNSWDGMGLISAEKMKEYVKELDLDYTPAAINVRGIGIKGLLVCVDFHKFASEQSPEINEIINLKGDTVDISDIDVILTASQWKLHSLFNDDWDEFDTIQNKNGLVWGIQRAAPKQDVEYTRLNYQLIQTSNLQDNDIEELLEPTKSLFSKLAEADDATTLMYLKDSQLLNDEIDNYRGTVINKAINRNRKMLHDVYVKEEIRNIIEGNLRQTKIGKIFARSNYQYMISDPYGLIQWALFRDSTKVTGLIPAYHVYSSFWSERGSKDIIACRSPMVDIGEHNSLTVCNDKTANYEIMSDFYKYIKSGIVYSIWDLSTIIHSDSDWDSDQVLTIDSQPLRCGIWKDKDGNKILPITYRKGLNEAKKLKYTIEAAVKSDIQGFGNMVGRYSNYATNYFAMLPDINEQSKKDEIYNNIKKLRMIVGEEIDSTKSGVKPELTSEFFYQKIKSEDKEEIKSKKLLHNQMVPKYKPYFFRYRDKYDEQSFTKYQSHMNIICQRLLYIPLEKLLAMSDDILTDEQRSFKESYTKCCPLLLTECTMNKLCWNMESYEKIILKNLNSKKAYDFVLLSFIEPIQLSSESKLYKNVREIYGDYSGELARIIKKIKTDKTVVDDDSKTIMMTEKKALQNKTKKKLYNDVCGNTAMLFKFIVASLADKDKYSVNNFLWNVFGYDVLRIIPKDGLNLKLIEDKKESLNLWVKNI